MYNKFAYWLATYFYVGCIKKAPGTFGSLATLPLAFVVIYFGGLWTLLITAIIVFIIGVKASKEVLKYTPHDPGFIVIDEVVGQLLSFVTVSTFMTGNLHAWSYYLTGFILFRIFDIAKPQPVRWADRKIINAWGVMLDDVIAGIYATLILYILHRFNILPAF